MSLSVAIYARVSTDAQAEHGYSLESQVDACEQYAKSIGAETVRQYVDDGYSGAYLERPALTSLRDALQLKMFDTVVCYTPDRLARRLSHQLLLTEEIENAGATLHFVNGDYKDTPEGRMFFQMQGAFAEYEREKIRERTMRGKRAKLLKQKPIQDYRTFGFDYDKEKEEYIINPVEANIVRLVFDLYTKAMVGGVTIVASEMMKRNIPTPRGKKIWRGTTVYKILTQQKYCGEYYAYRLLSRKISANKNKVIKRPKSEWVLMSCPAIVGKETFNLAQSLLLSNKNVRKRQYPKGIYLLQGIARCAICGAKVVVANNNRGHFYICYTRTRRDEDKKPCTARYAKTDLVDKAFWSIIKKICSSMETLSDYIKRVDKASFINEDQTAKAKARLLTIKNEKNSILDWFSNGLITKQSATEKLSALTKEAKQIEKKMSEQSQPQKTINVERIYKTVADYIEDENAKRNVIRSIVDYVEYKRTDDKRNSKTYGIKFMIHFR